MVRRRLSAFGVSFVMHATAITLFAWLGPLSAAPSRVEPQPTVVFVDSLPSDGGPAEQQPPDALSEDLGFQVALGQTNFILEGFTFDFGKIARRSLQLFPFLTRTLSFEKLLEPSTARQQGRLTTPRAAQPEQESAKPWLAVNDADLQAWLDKSWSRRDRWAAFVPLATLLMLHHPDEGRLPDLLHAYVAQNGLQPYAESTIRDPRLWAQLGLAADHADFIDFVSQYASRHPSSKTTTELLFLVENLARASLDALILLLDTDPGEQLQWTRDANRRAYDTLIALREHYRIQLERRALTSIDALTTYYDDTRLSILNAIIRTTPQGYRAGDARFLIGAIYWKRGKTDAAEESWRAMLIAPDDRYAIAAGQIVVELDARNGAPPDARRIDQILESENGRWLMFSIRRLRQFGYHLDTF
jgi:hypothetical protein